MGLTDDPAYQQQSEIKHALFHRSTHLSCVCYYLPHNQATLCLIKEKWNNHLISRLFISIVSDELTIKNS